MYFCITTTPFREWHNRRPPFFRRKAEPKNLKQKELSFKLRMKSCPAGMTPGRLYYTEKNQYVNTASAAVSGFFMPLFRRPEYEEDCNGSLLFPFCFCKT